MKSFLDSNFLLQSETAQKLYHEHAAKMPIIDYHCHLIPQQIADNYQFADLTEIWLGGDHYKWRAMRANGVPEEYITGDKPAYEKFEKWAETMQYAMRNPLYHWTHLELSRIFGIDKVLNPSTAREIYDECTAKLQTSEFRAQAIMERMNVEVVCTTDDPIDDLKYHAQIRQSGLKTKVLPAWRPDKAMAIENVDTYNEYLIKLEAAADMSILNFKNLIDALQKRHDFFASQGCSLSDHGLTTFYAEPYTDAEIEAIFLKARMKKELTAEEIDKFRSAMLYEFAVMDAKSDWVQQFHYGATRNNNARMFKKLGRYRLRCDWRCRSCNSAGPFPEPFGRRRRAGKVHFLQLEPARQRAADDNDLQLQRRYGSGQDAVWLRLVVPGSDSRYGKTDERIVRLRIAKPLCRNADRFS